MVVAAPSTTWMACDAAMQKIAWQGEVSLDILCIAA
jgi:hypothetical protein